MAKGFGTSSAQRSGQRGRAASRRAGVEGVDRCAAVIGGDAGLVELVVEGDRGVGPGGEGGGARDQGPRAARLGLARGPGDQGGDGARHAEGRVGGEHHRETRAAHEIAKGLEIALAPGQGRDEPGRDPGVGRGLRVPVQPHIGAQALGARRQGLGPQAGKQGVEVVLADLAPVEAPGDRQRHRQDGIAERIFGGLLTRFLNEPQEVLLQALRFRTHDVSGLVTGTLSCIGRPEVMHAHRSALRFVSEAGNRVLRDTDDIRASNLRRVQRRRVADADPPLLTSVCPHARTVPGRRRHGARSDGRSGKDATRPVLG